jgi:hypothetical protein
MMKFITTCDAMARRTNVPETFRNGNSVCELALYLNAGLKICSLSIRVSHAGAVLVEVCWH